MDFSNKSIKELASLIQDKKVLPSTLAHVALAKAHEYQPLYNAFVTITAEGAINHSSSLDSKNPTNPLFGIPYAIKDNFSTKDILTTASSNILKNYVPVFDSAVSEKLNSLDGVLIGKTVLDELAMGGSSTTGHTGKVVNPYSSTLEHMAGGSSGGSAAAVSSGIVYYALGSDTGDSVRKPASFCGIVGFKPTYGLISRFGLFPFATSLDHVGFFTRSVEDSAYVLEALAINDKRDMTSAVKNPEEYTKNLSLNVKGKKLAVIKGIVDSINDKKIVEEFNKSVEVAKSLGIQVDYVDMDYKLLKAILPVYVVISCAEATSNNACFDGIKYGYRLEGTSVEDSILKTRTHGFGEQAKRRMIMGGYFLKKENQDHIFIKAQKIRRLIVNATDEILKSYDGILLPAAGSTAPKFDSKPQDKLSDHYLIAENHLAIGNFGGYPSLTIPTGLIDGMPFGVNITGKVFDEQNVLNLAYAMESKLQFKNKVVALGGKTNEISNSNWY